MDLHTGLVYVGVVVVSAAVILLVSMFGIKEKSYEEAIAEQRKLPDDHLLMGKKEKSKEKKHKNKMGKRAKEKREDKEEKDGDKTENAAAAVRFEDNPAVLTAESNTTEVGKGAKKKNKNDKVKPILVNKEDTAATATESTHLENSVAEANHFDRIQPKDSLELIRSHGKETLGVQQSVQLEPITNNSPKETPSRTKKSVKEISKKKDEAREEKKETEQQQQIPKEPAKETKEIVKEVAPLASAVSHGNATTKETKDTIGKETKKGKRKNDILAQIGGDRDGINVSLLIPLVQKAELSRSEIQILIDQLLNKQQDNPSEHSEWTEGRTDPVIKLKKQLAEKEKALGEEHEASLTFQNKLRELRAELNSERSRFTTQTKQLEEALGTKITEAQTLHTRMQHILESHAAEKQGFARQIEQLQAKVNEDAAIIHKMQEEQGQAQGQLQQELIAQRKQLEVQFGQMRENENALKSQLAQKHIELQELQNVNISMTQELQATCESSTAEIEMLRQQLGMMQDQYMHSEGQLQHYKETGERMQDMARQLEESHRAHADFDHRLKSAHRHEQELQKQIHSLQAELKMAKTEANEITSLKSELNKAQAELMKIKSDLSLSRIEAKTEAAEITTLRAGINERDEELVYYKSEGTKLANVLRDERNEMARVTAELVKVQDDLREQRGENESVVQQLSKATNKISKLENELSGVLENRVVEKAENEALRNGDGKISDAQIEITRLQEENDRISAQLGKFGELQKELKQLRDENESLASQLAASTERPAAEGRENGIEDKLLEHTNLLEQKESQLNALNAELAGKESELGQIRELLESLRTQVERQNSNVKILEDDLETQRSKNNVSAEKIKAEQQESTRSLLERIFPDVKVSEETFDRWLEAFEVQVDAALTELKKRSVSDETEELEKRNENLRAMVLQYRQIIDETESMLKKLQSQMETEESRWESQLLQKENEASNLRIELKEVQKQLAANEKLKEKIEELEERLMKETNLREKSEAELSSLRDNCDAKSFLIKVASNHESLKSKQSQLEENNADDEEETKQDTENETKLHRLESELANQQDLRSQIDETELRGGGSISDQSTTNGPATSDSSKSEGGSGKK